MLASDGSGPEYAPFLVIVIWAFIFAVSLYRPSSCSAPPLIYFGRSEGRRRGINATKQTRVELPSPKSTKRGGCTVKNVARHIFVGAYHSSLLQRGDHPKPCPATKLTFISMRSEANTALADMDPVGSRSMVEIVTSPLSKYSSPYRSVASNLRARKFILACGFRIRGRYTDSPQASD